jgi:hypothetical protein
VLGYAGDWGSGSAGGLRGVGQTNVGGVLGYQHTSGTGTFTVSLALVNNTGAMIETLDVSYLGRVATTDSLRIVTYNIAVVSGHLYDGPDRARRLGADLPTGR